MLWNVLEEENGDVDGAMKTCIFIDVHIPPLFLESYSTSYFIHRRLIFTHLNAVTGYHQ